jgi:hypothetical protein
MHPKTGRSAHGRKPAKNDEKTTDLWTSRGGKPIV